MDNKNIDNKNIDIKGKNVYVASVANLYCTDYPYYEVTGVYSEENENKIYFDFIRYQFARRNVKNKFLIKDILNLDFELEENKKLKNLLDTSDFKELALDYKKRDVNLLRNYYDIIKEYYNIIDYYDFKSNYIGFYYDDNDDSDDNNSDSDNDFYDGYEELIECIQIE